MALRKILKAKMPEPASQCINPLPSPLDNLPLVFYFSKPESPELQPSKEKQKREQNTGSRSAPPFRIWGRWERYIHCPRELPDCLHLCLCVCVYDGEGWMLPNPGRGACMCFPGWMTTVRAFSRQEQPTDSLSSCLHIYCPS